MAPSVYIPNGIAIGSATFAGFTVITRTDKNTLPRLQQQAASS